LFGLAFDVLFVLLGLIWFSHIGFDRMVGFGLKYPNKKNHFNKV
jgi:hypothetical protein